MRETNWQLYYRHASRMRANARCRKRNGNAEINLYGIGFAIIDWPKCWPKVCNRPLHLSTEMSFIAIFVAIAMPVRQTSDSIRAMFNWMHVRHGSFNLFCLLRWMQKKKNSTTYTLHRPNGVLLSFAYIYMLAFTYPLRELAKMTMSFAFVSSVVIILSLDG